MRLLYFFTALLLILNSCKESPAPYQRVYQPLVEKDSTAIRINNYIQNFSGTTFNGIVLIAKKGELVLSENYGYCNSPQKQAFQQQTPVHIGALGKQFTAAAILQLEMKGLLATGDSLKKYFDNLPLDKQRITIHNLLTHTAGLTANLDLRDKNLADWLAITVLESNPGESFRYSNAGYHILSKIIEQVSGHSYVDYLEQAILNPLGMRQTSIQDSNWAYSTAEDMFLWYKVLSTEILLPQAVKNKFFQAYIPEGKNALNYQAYAWTLSQNTWKMPALTQNSSHSKGYAHISYYPKEDVFVFIATDREHSNNLELSQNINRLVFKTKAIPAPPSSVEILAKLPKDAQGKQLAKLLDTLSTGKTAEMTALIQDFFAPSLAKQLSIERHLSVLNHIQQEIQQAQLSLVERLGKSSYRLTLTDTKNASKNVLWIDLNPSAPFSITNFSIDTIRG